MPQVMMNPGSLAAAGVLKVTNAANADGSEHSSKRPKRKAAWGAITAGWGRFLRSTERRASR